jgi:hypothetical protein
MTMVLFVIIDHMIDPLKVGLSLADDVHSLYVVFSPRLAKKRHTIKTKYHAAAG